MLGIILVLRWSLTFIFLYKELSVGESKKQVNILLYRIIYTIIILLAYLLGKGIPLYMIDISAYTQKMVDTETLLLQVISGDIYKCSLFALGISPFMIASIIVQVISSCRKAEYRVNISKTKINKMTLMLALVIAIFQSIAVVQELQFRIDNSMLLVAKIIACLEMTVGAMLIVMLSNRNKSYGIGGQSVLIFANVIDSILLTIKECDVKSLLVLAIISILVIVIVIIMENTEKRIPVQRISIHSIYSDKNYLAIKFNPIGVMPAVFSMAFFSLVQLIFVFGTWIFPHSSIAVWCKDNMVLSKPFGIVMYILVLYCLTIGLSKLFINPGDITEQYLKNGDSIEGIHAGKDTKRYLSRLITRISILSATIMSVFLSLPIFLEMMGKVEGGFVTLPSSIMMLTGIWCNINREVIAIKDLDAYKPFF